MVVVFLTIALGACGAEVVKPGAAYVDQVRKDVPSLDDVSDADLLAYGR